MKRILIIDNYDSFVYNLVHMLYSENYELTVRRNDQIEMSEVNGFDKILLSPGPGLPAEAGLMPEMIKIYGTLKPIFGVCLGHQAIAEAFGGSLLNMPKVHHGLSEPINVIEPSDYFFRNVPERINVGRYHSWCAVDPLPEELIVTARDDEGTIMAIRHKELDIRGVQFHPESILTEYGGVMLENWLNHS